MLLICASEVQKNRRISTDLATRKTQMLVTAESTPPWPLTSDRQHLWQQPPIQLSEGLPAMEKENKTPPQLIASSANGYRGRSKSTSVRSAPSAQHNRQNSADPDKSEQRKVRPSKNKKKQVKPKVDMISSRHQRQWEIWFRLTNQLQNGGPYTNIKVSKRNKLRFL